MASAAAELFVKVSADIKGLTSGFKAVEDAVDDMGQAAQQAAKPMSNLGDIIKGTAAGDLLADGIRGAADAMVSLGTQSIKLAGELEQNKVAFTTMLGGAKQADAMLRELATFAASTPFELRGLTDSTKRLLAFGFDAKAIIPIMNSVGNAVAAVGGGKETLDGVTLALGQIAAKGKVSAEEMNQLAERGIPAWKMLADGIGVSIPEAMKKAEKGSIDASTAITALVNGMNQKFPGMMQKQSQTITGALSNLQDSADAALTKIGQKLIETFNLTRVVQQMSAAISNLTAAFTTGGLLGVLDKAFGPTTKAAIVGIAAALAGPMIASLAGVAGSFVAATVAAAPFLALGAAVAFAAYPIIKNWEGIRGTIVALWDTAATYTSAYYNRAVRVVNDLVKMFQAGFGFIGSSIRAVLGDELTNKLLGGVSKAAGAFRGFAEVAATPLRAVASLGSAAASNFSETWRGAMTMSQGFTNDLFRQAGGAARNFSRTLTADMLGLAKSSAAATASAGAAAKKHHETAAQAARRHTAEAKRVEDQYMRNLKTYLAQEEVTYKLGDALRRVAEDKQRLGRAFDEAGAKAEVYRSILGQLEAAFGKTSLQVRNTKTAIAELEAASRNGGAATAAAYRIVAEGAAELEKARAKAQALGLEFKATDEAIKTTEDTIRKLIDLGLKPGEKAYDEQIAKLHELRKAQEKVPPTVEQNIAATQKLGQSIEGVGRGADKLISGFGIAIPSIITDMVGGFFEGSMAVLGLASAFNEANQAMQDMDRKAKESNADGLLATLKAIALIVGIAKAGYDMYTKSVERHNEEQRKAIEESDKLAMSFANIPPHIQQMNFELEQSTIRAKEAFATIKDAAAGGLKDATLAFLAGAQNYGEIIREKVREGIFNAVVDAIMKKAMLQKFDELIAKIVQSFEGGVGVGTKVMVDELINSLKTTSKQSAEVIKQVLEGLGFVPAEIQRRADAAMGALNEMNKRNAEAIASYGANIQQSLNRTLERTLNRGSQTAEEANLIGRLLSEQEMVRRRGYETGMATGGLVTGPVVAKMGEGGRDEAVLPLNDRVFSSIAQGIASAGASGTQVVINYTGNGKWTREDAQGLGRLLVSELRAMGVR